MSKISCIRCKKQAKDRDRSSNVLLTTNRKSMLSVSCHDRNSKIRKTDLLRRIMLKDC